jgi:hypothetical protein
VTILKSQGEGGGFTGSGARPAGINGKPGNSTRLCSICGKSDRFCPGHFEVSDCRPNVYAFGGGSPGGASGMASSYWCICGFRPPHTHGYNENLDAKPNGISGNGGSCFPCGYVFPRANGSGGDSGYASAALFGGPGNKAPTCPWHKVNPVVCWREHKQTHILPAANNISPR